MWRKGTRIIFFLILHFSLSSTKEGSSNNKQWSKRLLVQRHANNNNTPANIKMLQSARNLRQIQSPSIPALYSAPKKINDQDAVSSSPSPNYGVPVPDVSYGPPDQTDITTEAVTEAEDVSTSSPEMDEVENEVAVTSRSEYLPPRKDQEMIETARQEQAQNQNQNQNGYEEDGGRQRQRQRYGVPSSGNGNGNGGYLPPPEQPPTRYEMPPRRDNEEDKGNEEYRLPTPRGEVRVRYQTDRAQGYGQGGYQPQAQGGNGYQQNQGYQGKGFGGSFNGGVQGRGFGQHDDGIVVDSQQGVQQPQQQYPQGSGGYPQQQHFPTQPGGGYGQPQPLVPTQPQPTGGYNQASINLFSGGYGQPHQSFPSRSSGYDSPPPPPPQPHPQSGSSRPTGGYSQVSRFPSQPQPSSGYQFQRQNAIGFGGYAQPQAQIPSFQSPERSQEIYNSGFPSLDEMMMYIVQQPQSQNGQQGYPYQMIIHQTSYDQPKALGSPSGQPETNFDAQGYPAARPQPHLMPLGSPTPSASQPQQPSTSSGYFGGSFFPQVQSNTIDTFMMQDEELEGLNGKIVDAALLERVQQIIEEHERQQKALFQNFEREGQFNQGQSQPQQQDQGFGYQQQNGYSSPPLPPQARSDQQQQQGYNIHSQSRSDQQQGYSSQSQTRLDQQQGYSSPSPSTSNYNPSFGDANGVQYQKAVLSQQFSETNPIPPQSYGSQVPHPQQDPSIGRSVNEPLHLVPAPNLGGGPEEPKPVYGVPLAPVIGLDSHENFKVVDDDQSNYLQQPQPQPQQSYGTRGRRRRVAKVVKLNTNRRRRQERLPVSAH